MDRLPIYGGMYMIHKAIKMDLQQCGNTQPIDVVQGEVWSRHLDILLFNGREPFPIPDNAAVLIQFRKADGKGGAYDTLPDGTPAWSCRKNILHISLAEQAMTFPGIVTLSVSLIAGGKRLTTFPVDMVVHQLARASAEESENYFNVTGFLVAPWNAKPGQYLRISGVNTEGRVTQVEAASPESAAMDPEQLYQIVDTYLEQNPPAQGTPGKDGVSVTHSWSGTVLSVTSASGTSSADLKGDAGPQGERGAIGPQGEKGDTGPQGASGVSPVVSVSKTGRVSTISISDAEGTKTVTVRDGEDGTSSQSSVPDYWLDHLEEKAEDICQAMADAGRNKSAFFFYSDAHWWQLTRSEVSEADKSYTVKAEPALLKWLYENTPISKTNFGGDFIGEEADIATAEGRTVMAYIREWRKALRALPRHHSVVGNHDDGNDVNNRYSDSFIYSYLLAAEECPEIVQGDAFYYYIDEHCERTRYLYLDTAYKGLTSEQTAFVTDALKTTPEGWHIVAIAHIWYDANYDTTPPSVGSISANGAALLSLFDSYNARSGDFAECGGWVEFCIGGHTHLDFDGASDGGIPVVLVESSSLNDRSGLGYTVGTITESAVSAIVANYQECRIDLIRIGRGANRSISLTNHASPSYTNQLAISTDADGNIYNGTGYKADTRWSGSGNTESSLTGKYLSGYIPYTPGQTVYLKNVTMPADDSNSAVHYFSARGTRISGLGGANVLNYFAGVTDGNNHIVQFTIPNYGDYVSTTYIRIECTGFDETSIVTVDEPIV